MIELKPILNCNQIELRKTFCPTSAQVDVIWYIITQDLPYIETCLNFKLGHNSCFDTFYKYCRHFIYKESKFVKSIQILGGPIHEPMNVWSKQPQKKVKEHEHQVGFLDSFFTKENTSLVYLGSLVKQTFSKAPFDL